MPGQIKSQKGQTIKLTISSAFFWNVPLPNPIHYFFLWGTNLQYTAILLWIQFKLLANIEKDVFSTGFYIIIKFFSLGEYMSSPVANTNKTLVLLTWIYFILFIIIHAVVLIKGHITRKVSKFENCSICFLNQLHLTFGFWAVSALSFPFTTEKYLQTDEIVSYGSFRIQGGILKVSCIIMIIVNYVSTLFISIVSYDPIKSSSLFSVHTPIFQVHNLIFKAAILPIMSVNMDSTVNAWLSILFSLVWASYRHYQLVEKFPYYHYSPMKHAIIISSGIVLISCVNTLVIAVEAVQLVPCLDILLIEVILMPLALKFSNQYLQRAIRQSLQNINAQNLHTENQLIKKLFSLAYVKKNAKFTLNNEERREEIELYVWALWSQFYSIRENLVEVVDSNKGNTYQQLEVAYLKHIQDGITKILLGSVQRLQSKNKLKIILADHLLTQNPISPVAISTLLSMSKQNDLHQVEGKKILKDIEQRLHNFYKSGEGTVVDMKTYIDFKTDLDGLLKLISGNIKRILDFWTSYKKPEQKIWDLFLKNQVIEKEDYNLRKSWAKHMGNNIGTIRPLTVLYSSYLSLIRNAPYSGHKVLELTKLLQNDKSMNEESTNIVTRSNLEQNKTTVVYVSLSKERFGKIVDIFPNISKIVTWRREELLQKDINILVPDFMKEKHTQLMTRHVENVISSSRLNKNIDTYLKAKEGHLLPCYIHLSLYPYIDKELVYLGVLKPKRNYTTDQIVVNQQGIIQGFTKGLELQTKEVMIKRKTDNKSRLVLFKEAFSLKKAFETTEPGSPRNLDSNRHQRQSDEYNEALTSRRTQDNCHKQTEMRVEELISQFQQNHIVTENYYDFGGERFTVLNLQRFASDFMDNNKKMTASQPKQNKKKNIMSYSCQNKLKEGVISSEAEVDENNLHENTPISSNRFLLTKNSQRTSLMERRSIFGTMNRNSEPRAIGIMPNKSNKVTLLDSASNTSSYESSMGSNSEKYKTEVLDSSQSSSLDKRKMYVERALYTTKKDKKIRNLCIFLSVFLVLASILLVFLEVKNQNTLVLLEGNIDILNNQSMLLLNTINIRRMITFFLFIDNGIFGLERYEWAGVPDSRYIVHMQIAPIVKDLNQENMAIRDSLHKINENLRYKFYQKIPVYGQNSDSLGGSIRNLDLFALMSDIIAASNRIINRPFNKVSGNDSDVLFIYNNTHNEFLIAGENAINTIVDDVGQKLDSNLMRYIITTTFTFTMTLILLIYVLFIIRSIIQERNKVLDIFLRLEGKCIDNHIMMLKKFCGILDQNSMSMERLTFKLRKINPEKPDILLSKCYENKRREMNKAGINNKIRRIVLITFGLLSLVLSCSIILLTSVNQQNHQISRKVSAMVNIYSNLYNLAIVFNFLHEYVMTNGTSTLGGQPIKEQWENTFNSLTITQNHFRSITDLDLGIGSDITLLEIFEGNLCKIIAPDPYAGAICSGLLYGTLQKGLIRLNTFMMMLVQRVKLNFDNSARTKQDMFNVLNTTDVIQSEAATALYIFPAYKMIAGLVKEQLYNDFKLFGVRMTRIIMGVIASFIICGGILSYKLKHALLDHKYDWKKLLRLVPAEMVISNKLIQAYLFDSSLKFSAIN